MSDLIERLRAGVARLKEYTDAPAGIYTVPGPIDRLAVKRDDVLMAQYRIAEAAAAVEDYNNALAEIERLKAALKPFADIADECDDFADVVDFSEDDRISIVQTGGCQLGTLSIDDFRTARSALGETK